MRRGALLALLMILVIMSSGCQGKKGRARKAVPQKPHTLDISSTAFSENSYIPAKYTCDGENISPPLKISGVPAKTKSLVLTFRDPDAPKQTFYHWLAWNIEPGLKEISEGKGIPGAVLGKNGMNKTGYIGPCPPSGDHRYIFGLYALNMKLNLPAGSKVSTLMKAMDKHVLEQDFLIGRYQRPLDKQVKPPAKTDKKQAAKPN